MFEVLKADIFIVRKTLEYCGFEAFSTFCS